MECGGMMGPPAIFLLLLAFGVVLIVRVLLLRSDRTAQDGQEPAPECPQCGHRNVPEAKYCARCGTDLRNKLV